MSHWGHWERKEGEEKLVKAYVRDRSIAALSTVQSCCRDEAARRLRGVLQQDAQIALYRSVLCTSIPKGEPCDGPYCSGHVCAYSFVVRLPC